ncbi:MAG: phosphoribosylanthranilate isomerase [Spirochaetota bacterium]
MRPLVKICGLTNYEDAALALGFGADIIGFVLAPSPRRTEPALVADMVRRLRDAGLLEGKSTVAVFVNEEAGRMGDIVAGSELSYAQIHGDEVPAACADFTFPWYRALRHSEASDAERLAGRDGRSWSCSRLLFDAAIPGAYGGTGTRIGSEAALAARQLTRAGGKEFFLAGGIGPGNVAALVREFQPDGIDIGSGVEEAPGKKSRTALRDLFMCIDRMSDEERQSGSA